MILLEAYTKCQCNSGFILMSLRENCLYSEYFWAVFSPNAGKYGPEKLRIRTFFTQCVSLRKNK